ncbi:MAG TPA: tetratricopeptide repeat protein [Thermoguttaceae bacterium]|nr:tetratricopeptide repeat protein [Thermoguttaceae bacterium]
MKFKIYFVNDEGQAASFRAKRGSLEGDILTLDDTIIPVAAIVEVDVRSQYLVLSVMTEDEQPVSLVISTGKAKRLKAELGRLRSAVWAKMHRERLESKGLGHTFRQEDCPACGAVLDLTGMESSPQMSCNFCHTISTIPAANMQAGDTDAQTEHGYRLCDECGMYSRPRQFTIFYFYFLVVLYGWRSRITWRCPGCMRGEAWKMLFGNMIFVLGVPTALIQLFRAYGGTDVGGLFPGLDRANLQAKQGDLSGAIGSYQEMLGRRPVAAGVKFNIGLAFLKQERYEDAAKMFEFALADCANYQPAAAALATCYETLAETDKLAALKLKWEGDDEDQESEQDRSAGNL